MPGPLKLVTNTPQPGCWNDQCLLAVEDFMADLATGTRFDQLGAIVREHLSTGGKRLRARLALATVQALGAERDQGVPWAAAAELLHNATLVHDDIQDGDPMRRGRPAVWAAHGVNQAINVGDLLLMLPYRAVSQVAVDPAVKWSLCNALAIYAEDVVRGQSEEMGLLPHCRFDWDGYRAAAEGKTAALFSLPVYGGARIAGWTEEQAVALADEMRPIGLLFQIADDVLDLYGDKGREAPGGDLREGKVSALVSEHLRLHPRDGDWLIPLLSCPREDTPDRLVTHAIERFRHGGALGAVWERMGAIESRIHDSELLASVPKLHAAAFDLVTRALRPILHTDSFASTTSGLERQVTQ